MEGKPKIVFSCDDNVQFSLGEYKYTTYLLSILGGRLLKKVLRLWVYGTLPLDGTIVSSEFSLYNILNFLSNSVSGIFSS